jgi:hypothetical protein
MIKFGFINFLAEAADPRIPHPEDAIFGPGGSADAAKAVQSLKGAIAQASNMSIKWDGGIALWFGRNEQGQLVVTDKYMPDKGVLATSPEQWREYDLQKKSGTTRDDLYAKLANMWPALDKAVVGPGWFFGDLMYAEPLQPVSGRYVFKGPTVEYRVPIESPLGHIINKSIAGIVVHVQSDAPGGAKTPWDGNGLRNIPGGVAIINPTLGIKFHLKEPVQLSRAADAAIKKYGAATDQFLATQSGTAKALLQQFFNKRITNQPEGRDLVEFLKAKASGKQFQILVGDQATPGALYVQDEAGGLTESPGYSGLKAIWNAIYAFKINLNQQLEAQVKGLEQFSGGQPGGEGFVFPSPNGLVKIVNRGQFGAAHFNK